MPKKEVVLFTKGVIKDVPPSMLEQGFCSAARHVSFEDGFAQKMLGYTVHYDTADDHPINGLWVFKGSDLETYIISGTKHNLSKIITAGTKTSLVDTYNGLDTATTTAEANPWSFANFGNVLLCTNGMDAVQKFVSPYAAANMTTLTGPPVSDVVKVHQRHVFVCGNLISATNPRRVTWSDIDDYLTWTPAADNDAGYQDLYESRTRCVGGDTLGDYFVAYTENQIHVFQYIAGAYVYGRRVADWNVGLWKKMLIANSKSAHFFMGKDNFYAFDGNKATPIGDGIKKDVWASLVTTQMSKAFAFTNERRGEAHFVVPITSGAPSLDCIYNWRNGAWSFDNVLWWAGVDRGDIAYPLITYGGAVATTNNKIFTIDITDADPTGIAFTAANNYVDSKEYGADDIEVMKVVNRIYPIIQSNSTAHIYVKIGFRNDVNTSVTWSSAYPLHPSTGGPDIKIDTRNAGSGRLWRLRVYTDELSTPFLIAKIICDIDAVGSRT